MWIAKLFQYLIYRCVSEYLIYFRPKTLHGPLERCKKEKIRNTRRSYDKQARTAFRQFQYIVHCRRIHWANRYDKTFTVNAIFHKDRRGPRSLDQYKFRHCDANFAIGFKRTRDKLTSVRADKTKELYLKRDQLKTLTVADLNETRSRAYEHGG